MNAAAFSRAQVLAVFAHELREPLGSILFAARELAASKDVGHTGRGLCAIIERLDHYAAKLIENAFEVCRADAGKIHLHEDRFDLRLVVGNAVETTGPLLTERKHRLALVLPAESIYVTADALRLQQVVVNLLANAARHSPVGGQIQLSMEAAGSFALIKVRDEGCGISLELLPQVFDFYRQGETPSSQSITGLGIGLALVKFLVELHGGSVRAHSDGVGTGSTFVVRLPITGATIRKTCDHQTLAPKRRSTTHRPADDAIADA